uniref:Uncharacterized protein n=1 Tax=Chromera velia CCMP2878 TaxID=1169474 RepID=A0A0G4IEY7_9ALVE|mmetsp:Transcript_34844/g.68793  ORF Transcript_34844/g.68793 Transcript_34844/m.68793 type:complete len:320 (+) Transcript_34844:70-1029(+)|eukprot:Cvel_2410.t1-p1 / transcript=Cvel_2410.t1 / gene=Cvel_2410 / organism=Chromera_velia_CCMP2878 / gene_product=hypothetical protein / transcript_product=hypothetical protein / location=Cvel_scaffold94:34433-37185(-) / protein_length=319 / sequence_SO=supercontig / SO=protein_coding / is_pseudo=false
MQTPGANATAVDVLPINPSVPGISSNAHNPGVGFQVGSNNHGAVHSPPESPNVRSASTAGVEKSLLVIRSNLDIASQNMDTVTALCDSAKERIRKSQMTQNEIARELHQLLADSHFSHQPAAFGSPPKTPNGPHSPLSADRIAAALQQTRTSGFNGFLEAVNTGVNTMLEAVGVTSKEPTKEGTMPVQFQAPTSTTQPPPINSHVQAAGGPPLAPPAFQTAQNPGLLMPMPPAQDMAALNTLQSAQRPPSPPTGPSPSKPTVSFAPAAAAGPPVPTGFQLQQQPQRHAMPPQAPTAVHLPLPVSRVGGAGQAPLNATRA